MTETDGTTPARPYTRRQFLGQLGAAGATGLTASLIGTSCANAAARRATGPTLLGRATRKSPVKQIVVLCQENHSFDHYLGSYPKLPSGYGIPSSFPGWTVKPFPIGPSNTFNPNHDWTSTHASVDGGKMDGFVAANGPNSMGYHVAKDIPYYYSLIPEFTLCAEYHCGVLGPTYPNRLVLYSGTSGGYTDNSAALNGSVDEKTWPSITTLLKASSVTYANYNFYCPSDSSLFALWNNNYKQANMNRSRAQFMSDARNGTLPQVSFVTEAPPYDEHPGVGNLAHGEYAVSKAAIEAVKAGPLWDSTVILLTWDEGGGFFDHRAPKVIDHFGSGIRVPLFVVSPLARKGFVDTAYSDHVSVLKFIEHVFGLPTLASINHTFDTSTPGVGQGGGAPFPPRDGNSAISNLTQCFTVAV